MLVLSRKIGESLIIDNNIDVKIIAIKGSQIRIGINAPKEIIIDRYEIHKLRKNR